MASSDVQIIQKPTGTVQDHPDCSGIILNSTGAPNLTQPPGPYSTHGKTRCTTHQWAIGWYHMSHTTAYLNAKASLITKLLPNPHYINPWPAMSYTDPAPTGIASQHVPQTKWPGYVQTRPRTSRLLQLHPNTPGTSRPPQITADHHRSLQINCSSTGTPETTECLN